MPSEIYHENSSFEPYFDCLAPMSYLHSVCFSGALNLISIPHNTHSLIKHQMLGESLLKKNLIMHTDSNLEKGHTNPLAQHNFCHKQTNLHALLDS